MNAIDHQVENKRFVLTQDGSECLLEYTLSRTVKNQLGDHQRVDFTHTYVPSELRGQKLAEQLVNVGLAWAKEQGYQIDASCSYVRQFL
jgi:predicted GNAT family acetyltransferase